MEQPKIVAGPAAEQAEHLAQQALLSFQNQANVQLASVGQEFDQKEAQLQHQAAVTENLRALAQQGEVHLLSEINFSNLRSEGQAQAYALQQEQELHAKAQREALLAEQATKAQ